MRIIKSNTPRYGTTKIVMKKVTSAGTNAIVGRIRKRVNSNP